MKESQAYDLRGMKYFKRTPISYRVILITALVMATLFLLQSYMHHFVYADVKDMGEFRWLREAPVPYLNFLFWALLLPLAYMSLQRWPLTSDPAWRSFLVLSVIGLGIGTLHEVTTSAIYYTILWSQGDFKFEPEYLNWAVHALPPAILSRFLEFWVLVGVLTAAMHYKQMREKQQQLALLQNELQSAQLQALKKQLQPHFLFNTLNTVSALMDENVADARKVLSRLGQLLRITLDKEQRDRVTLAREVDYIRNYLDIESVRFHDRLTVTYDIPEQLSTALVPSMMLQPLVENAIKHGPDATSDRVDIHLTARHTAGQLVVTVQDNGKGCKDVRQAMEHGGIGLRNVHDRLRLLFGDRARMDLDSPGGKGFLVTLTLPLEQPAGA